MLHHIIKTAELETKRNISVQCNYEIVKLMHYKSTQQTFPLHIFFHSENGPH